MVNMPSFAVAPLPNGINMTWPPSFGEWLTARCGHPSKRRDSMCELQTQFTAARDAVRAFRAGEDKHEPVMLPNHE